PAGEPLARYEVAFADGSAQVIEVRRRFEIADGIIGWGFLPFAAIGHRADEALDWRGPHPRQAPGRYVSAGQAGLLAMLPGSWGAAQTGVADFVPTPDDDATYWLHSIPLAADTVPVGLRVMPVAGGRPGSAVAIAALTLFDGTADPLVADPRRQLLVEGDAGDLPEVDLGIAIAARSLDLPAAERSAGPTGWGSARAHPVSGPRSAISDEARVVVDIAATPDARITVA